MRASQAAVNVAAATLVEHLNDSAESWHAQDGWAVALTLSRLMLEAAMNEGLLVAA